MSSAKTTQPISVRLPENLLAALQRECGRAGRTLSEVVVEALEQRLFGDGEDATTPVAQQELLAGVLFCQALIAKTSGAPEKTLRSVRKRVAQQAADLLAGRGIDVVDG